MTFIIPFRDTFLLLSTQMHTGNELKKYFEKRIQVLDRILKNPVRQYNPEQLHQLRIEIKKISALFTMLKKTDPNFQKEKTKAPFEMIYSQAGRIRSVQVEENMLKKLAKNGFNKSFLSHLKIIKSEEKAIFSRLNNNSHAGGIHQTSTRLFPMLMNADGKKIKSFIRKKGNKIENLLKKKKIDPKDGHELRKQIKAWYYLAKSLDMYTKKLLSEVNKLQDLLGTWHDWCMLEKDLKKWKDRDDYTSVHADKTMMQVQNKIHSLWEQINKTRFSVSFSKP
jgi:CHAD domain-containing protein